MTYSPEQLEKARGLFLKLLKTDPEVQALVYRIAHMTRDIDTPTLTRTEIINRIATVKPLPFKGRINAYIVRELKDAFPEYSSHTIKEMLKNHDIFIADKTKFIKHFKRIMRVLILDID